MVCLINYIGLDGTGYIPPSNLYVNRELTIPIQNVSAAINNEQATLEGIWNEVQQKGIKKFVIRLRLGMMELYSDCSDVTEAWICENKAALAMPLVYWLGVELMGEIFHTNRINRFTTIDRQRAEQMRAEFQSEFQIQLKAALQSINTQPKIELGEVFTYVEAIP